MNTGIKRFLHRHHYPFVIAIIIAAAVASFLLYEHGDDWKIVVPIIGGAVSLIYIIEKQQLEEAKLFKDLFKEFNSRYEALNDRLNSIPNDFDPTENQDLCNVLDEYFNLCGEEYLYYRQGFIYSEVWQSWVHGMFIHYQKDSVRKLWEADSNTKSCYGFNIKAELMALKIIAADSTKLTETSSRSKPFTENLPN